MAEEPEELAEDEESDGSEEEAGEKKKRFAGRTLMLFIVLPLLLLGGGGTTMFVFDPLGLFSSSPGGEDEEEEPKEVVFYDMPEMLVNLSQLDKRSQYLKIKIAFEMTDPDARSTLDPMMPRIMDIFQVYLRELRAEDLEGSAGVYRLKEELLRRVNLVINPNKIDRVLFKEMIVQ